MADCAVVAVPQKMWLDLPIEITQTILCTYVDGKTLSTFIIAARGCKRHENFVNFEVLVQTRLRSIQARLANHPYQENNIRQFIGRCLQHIDDNQWRNLAECLAVVDYFESYSSVISSKAGAAQVYEFPVFVGPVAKNPQGARVWHRPAKSTMDVIIRTPCWWATSIVDFKLSMMDNQDQVRLELVHYNYQIVPPLGRVSAIKSGDNLRQYLANDCVDSNQIWHVCVSSQSWRLGSMLFPRIHAAANCSSFLRHDFYSLKKKMTCGDDDDDMYCLVSRGSDYHQTLTQTIESMIELMRNIDVATI